MLFFRRIGGERELAASVNSPLAKWVATLIALNGAYQGDGV